MDTTTNKLHPGVLIKECLTQNNISSKQLADAIKASPALICRIITGGINLSADIALRLSAVLGGRSAEEWLQIQNDYDLAKARMSFDASKLTPLIGNVIDNERN